MGTIIFAIQPKFLYPDASPCLWVTEGEAFADKNPVLIEQLPTQMLRPYL